MTDKEAELVGRVGRLIRGDWSGNIFDGRDVRDMLDLIIAGKLEEAEKEIAELEKEY